MLPLSKVEQYARQHLRYNVKVGLADGGFFGIALGFASFGTILPLFVASMTDSATLIGLVPAIHAAGWLFPQLFTAKHTARLRRYKRTVLINTIHERVPFLGFAIVAFLLPTIGIQAGLILSFILLTWQGLGGGFTANPWTSMISKIIPPENRGTFIGMQAAVANLFISGAAVGAGYLLDFLESPLDFAICFFIASFFFTISWFALARTREPEDTERVIEQHQTSLWKGARQILQRDKNFSWFLVSRFLSQFGTMGFSFYIVYALRRFDADTVILGYLTATLTIAQTIANVSMGWFGDRLGHRSMLILGAAAAMLSSLLAWLANSINWFFPIFILAGFANVSIWMNGMTMATTFSGENERPFYIGLAQTLTAPATIIAPLLGGWIADAFGFVPTFSISTILSMVMMAILWFVVKDPHQQAITRGSVLREMSPGAGDGA
jgi:MFS family permease